MDGCSPTNLKCVTNLWSTVGEIGVNYLKKAHGGFGERNKYKENGNSWRNGKGVDILKHGSIVNEQIKNPNYTEETPGWMITPDTSDDQKTLQHLNRNQNISMYSIN